MDMEKFVFRRVVTSVIWSENKPTFIASENCLLNTILTCNQKVSTEPQLKKCIKWELNPPSLPNQGVFLEWLVKSFIMFCKRVLDIEQRGMKIWRQHFV